VQKWWSLLFGAVLAASFGSFILAYCHVGWWLPKDISTFGYKVDFLFYVILAITAFFFVLTEAILVYNMYCYIAQPGRKSGYTHGNHKLEVFWTSVTAVVLVFIAVAQIRAWEDIKYQTRMPAPDQVFEVSARQFEWRLRHPSPSMLKDISTKWKSEKPGGEPVIASQWAKNPQADDVYVVNEVHTWKGAKVRLFLKTRDVIHSFFLPNMRLKQDALPGKTIPVWFETKDSNVEWDEAAGAWKISEKWELACAELCGWGHSKMQGRLFVHKDQQDYERWLQQVTAKQDAHAPADDVDKPKP
jgi:cytochrome c oxidase subunit 2